MNYQLKVLDYVILVSVFLITMFIGLYYGFKEKFLKIFKKNSKDTNKASVSDYLTANSSMNPIPVALSLLATYFSTTSLLGNPAEVYLYGLEYWVVAFGGMTTPLIGAYLTGPLFARLEVCTIFQYLQLRFRSKYVKYVGTVCYILKNFISIAIFIFGPAVSLKLFSNLSEIYSIILVGSIGTLYTTIGGIKGVIWTDVFQLIVMIIALVLFNIKGIINVGGFGKLFEINSAGGRLNVLDFDPNPLERQTFWTLFFGFFVIFTFSYATDQASLQRFQASRSKKLAQRALLLNIPGIFIIISLCCFLGLVIYANVANCDPLLSKQISNPNELVGFFVAEFFKDIQGAAGLFLASAFCGSLSSVSSSLNSLSSIIWEDYLKSIEFFQKLDESKHLITTKIIVIVCGILSTLLSFIILSIGANLAQISNSLNGAIISPIVGLFVVGCFFKKTNSIGAIVGSITGFLFVVWISFGAFVVKPYYPKLTVSTEMCNFNLTLSNQTIIINELKGFNKIYSISYMLYTPLGTLVTVLVGLIVSLITGGSKHYVDDSLILFDLLPCGKKRKIKPEAEKESKQNSELIFL